jgi:hypothetical protein
LAPGIPWQARVRAAAQRVGVEPRNFRRLRWLHKLRLLERYDARPSRHLGYVLLDPEPHNFTYEIANPGDLAEWVASTAGVATKAAQALIAEAEHDATLHQRLLDATRGTRWLWSKRRPPFGKRLGWYALARALRPQLILETGVHDGLGSLLLLRALELNADGGRLVSFDINPAAGWLVGSHPLWEFRVESSGDGLPAVLGRGDPVGMFIYDGWHVHEAERSELELVAPRLAPGGVLLSDDAQVTSAMTDVCTTHGLECREVQLIAKDHFHPGTVLASGRRPGG